MGTRADFYVGTDPATMEWLGSIAWDAYPEGIPDTILGAPDLSTYRSAVAGFLASREDATLPEHGWPWPWHNSATTDFAYTYRTPTGRAGCVCVSCFGRRWLTVADYTNMNDADKEAYAESNKPADMWPNMGDRQNVTFGPRSGLIVLGG